MTPEAVTVYISRSPDETFALGRRLGLKLAAGDAVLLSGDLGAGKTMMTKGIVSVIGFDVDEVTSPSFALVNLYRTAKLDVYHLDLWRLEAGRDVAHAVGLNEIAEQQNAVIIIEWSEKLDEFAFRGRVYHVMLDGDGDDERRITITGNRS